MKNDQKNITKNQVQDSAFKKISKDDLWRFRAGLRADSYI